MMMDDDVDGWKYQFNVNKTQPYRLGLPFGPRPEWVGLTVTGPSPAEGHLPWPGVLLMGELTQVPHYPECEVHTTRKDDIPGGCLHRT